MVEITTLYVVVTVGVAMGFEMFGLFNQLIGVQLYLKPPVAFN